MPIVSVEQALITIDVLRHLEKKIDDELNIYFTSYEVMSNKPSIRTRRDLTEEEYYKVCDVIRLYGYDVNGWKTMTENRYSSFQTTYFSIYIINKQ